MELQLFNWESVDALGNDSYNFYDITLKQEIAGHPPGSKFTSALLSYEYGVLDLLDENGDIVVEVKLKLVVE